MKLDYQRIDGHLHIKDEPDLNLSDLIHTMEDIRIQNNFETTTILSLPCWDKEHVMQNPLAIAQKFCYPENTYYFGGLDYYIYPDYPRNCQFEKQLETFLNIGADGMKLIESKPTVRKMLHKVPFTDPIYEKFFELLDDRKVPVYWQSTDPQTFWNADEAPAWAMAAGWFYGDGTYPDIEELREETETILGRYPNIPMTLTHFFFLSDDLERADRLLDRYPNVRLDITPGTEMYGNFPLRLQEWRDFFIKHQDRIIFGTDSGWHTGVGMQGKLNKSKEIARDVTTFLCTDENFKMEHYDSHGINLPEDVAKKIMRDNYKNLIGHKPKTICAEAACEYFAEVERLLKAGSLADKEHYLNRIREITAIVSGKATL